MSLIDAQTHYASLLQSQPPSQMQASLANISDKNRAQMEKTAQDFESFFMAQMFQYMSSGIKADSTFGGGQAEEMLRSLLTDEYGKLSSRAGRGIGIADSVMREMIKLQDVQNDQGIVAGA